MLRKLLCAAVVFCVSIGVVAAEELFGAITKVDDKKITFKKFPASKEVASATTEFTVVENVKVVKAKFNKETKKVEADVALEGGLKNECFDDTGKFGLMAQVVLNDRGKVTEIRVFPRAKKKKAPE